MDLEISERGRGPQRVVFVHGVLDRGRSFDRVAALLDDECRMIWYDRRGYGASVDAEGAPAGIERHVEDLLTVLDGRPAVVVGHSFGGVTVLGAALRAPELFDAVALYETGMAWAPGWDDAHLHPLLWGEDPAGDGVRMMFGARYDTMSEQERAHRRREGEAFIVEERAVRTEILNEHNPPYDVADLAVPLVYGVSDDSRFAVVRDHLLAVVPLVDSMTIPGGGHNAHRTQPEAFADLVRRAVAIGARR